MSVNKTEFEKWKHRTLKSVLGLDVAREEMTVDELATEFGQRSGPRRRRRCSAHGCETEIEAQKFMCRRHWFGLHRKVRDAIGAEYTRASGRRGQINLRHFAVHQHAIGEVAYSDGPGRAVALEYFKKGERFRKLAIAQGLGDPFETFEQICCAGFPLGEPHPETDVHCFHWPAEGTYKGNCS